MHEFSRYLALGASCSGAIAVALGAFGAHALKAKLTPELQHTWSTASQYHFWHTLALFIVAWAAATFGENAMIRGSGYAMAIGIILFSGSLYVLCLSGVRWLGAITPLGGLSLIAGWLMLAIGLYQARPQ